MKEEDVRALDFKVVLCEHVCRIVLEICSDNHVSTSSHCRLDNVPVAKIGKINSGHQVLPPTDGRVGKSFVHCCDATSGSSGRQVRMNRLDRVSHLGKNLRTP